MNGFFHKYVEILIHFLILKSICFHNLSGQYNIKSALIGDYLNVFLVSFLKCSIRLNNVVWFSHYI